MVSFRWLNIKYSQVFINTIILTKAYHGVQISALTVISELRIRRRLPFDPNVVHDIILDVARQMI
jgi:hypothetical protein